MTGEDKTEKNLTKLQKIIDTLKGRKDVKARLAVLTDPENLTTMSVLSENEAHFIAVANFVTTNPLWGMVFEPLQEYAHSILEPNISVHGLGREQAIKFVAAINEAKAVTKLGEKMAGDKLSDG